MEVLRSPGQFCKDPRLAGFEHKTLNLVLLNICTFTATDTWTPCQTPNIKLFFLFLALRPNRHRIFPWIPQNTCSDFPRQSSSGCKGFLQGLLQRIYQQILQRFHQKFLKGFDKKLLHDSPPLGKSLREVLQGIF